jgi:nucleoside-diphosphate-sugar epimerase
MLLVTGASGHLGANLVRRLLDDGETVRVLVRRGSNNTALDGLNVECVYGDLRHLPSVRDAVRGCEGVFHCAAKLSITAGNEREIFDSNVVGTRHVLLAAREQGVRRVVVTGSLSAVGNDPAKPSDESMLFYPFDNHLPYATTKAFVEHECLKAVVDGLDVVIATSCAIIGPNDFLPSRMGRLLVDFANGKLRAYVPGGFEFVAARDLVEGHLLAMEKGRPGQKYIFGTEFMTVDNLMALYEDVTGQPRPRIRFSPAAAEAMAQISTFVLTHFFPSKPQRFTPAAIQLLRMQRKADSSKARSELGYQPTTIAGAVRDAYDCFVRRGVITPSTKRRVLVSRPRES